MADVVGQARALTVFTPIVQGHVNELRAYLDGLPTGADSPLARTAGTHFARWVILPQLIYEGRPQRRELLRTPYLIFTSNFDGELDPYLDALASQMPAEAHEIWRHCAGYPGEVSGQAFKTYIRRHSVPNSFFVAAYGDASVAQVRSSIALKKRFADFVARAQTLEPGELRDAFQSEFG